MLPMPTITEFVLIGDPYQPNGGILTRFTSWSDLPVLGDIFPFGRPGLLRQPVQDDVLPEPVRRIR